MADLTVLNLPTPFADIEAGDLTLDFVASSESDTFTCLGRDILLARNTDEEESQTITITGVADEKDQTENLVYEIPAGETIVIPVGLTNSRGWKNDAGKITITSESSSVLLAVFRIPPHYP